MDCSTKWYNISEDREQRRKKKPVASVVVPGPVLVATVIPATADTGIHEDDNINHGSHALNDAVAGAATGRIVGERSERSENEVVDGSAPAGVLQPKKKRMRRADVKQLAQEASKAGKSDDVFEYEAQQGLRMYPTKSIKSTNPTLTQTTSAKDTANQISHDQEHVRSSSSSGGGGSGGSGSARSVLSTTDLADITSPQALITIDNIGNNTQTKNSSHSRTVSATGVEDDSPLRITRTRGHIEDTKIMTRALAASKPTAADLWKATYVHNLGKTVRAAQNGNGKGASKSKGKGPSAVSRALAPAAASIPGKGSKSGTSNGTAVQVGGMVAGLVGGRVKMMSAVDKRRISPTGNHAKTNAKNSSKGRRESKSGAEVDSSGGSEPNQQSKRRSNSEDIALLLDHQRELGLMDIDDLYDHEPNDEDADDGYDDYAADLADDEDGDYN